MNILNKNKLHIKLLDERTDAFSYRNTIYHNFRFEYEVNSIFVKIIAQTCKENLYVITILSKKDSKDRYRIFDEKRVYSSNDVRKLSEDVIRGYFELSYLE